MKIPLSQLLQNMFRLAIILVSATKLLLLNKGFLAFYDERRYYASGKILDSLYEGQLITAIQYIFSTQGRPGYTLLSLIPTSLQVISAQLFGMDVYESANAWPLFVYNFIVYICLLLVQYKFSLLVLNNRSYALFSVLLLSLLAASHISLRHADPYDASLLILYYVLYKIMKQRPGSGYSEKRIFILGMLAFFGFSCYPGYILLFLIIPIMLLRSDFFLTPTWRKLRPLIVFGCGGMLCLIAYEALARSAGRSYVMDSANIVGAITQGDFSDSFIFLFRYLIEAEQFTGILLIAGIVLFSYAAVQKLIASGRSAFNDKMLLFTACLMMFVMYSVFGYFFEKVVWYARLLKQFLPLLVVFLVFGIVNAAAQLKLRENTRIVIASILSVTAIANFIVSFREYNTYVYPRDVAWDYYNEHRFHSLSEVYEYKNSIPEMPPFPAVSRMPEASNTEGWLFVNICEVYPFDDMQHFRAVRPKGYTLLFSEPYAVKYKPYQFEGYNLKARKNIDSVSMRIRVYKKR